ncbi:hypothetical protein D3C81_1617270 [compost metagenome]
MALRASAVPPARPISSADLVMTGPLLQGPVQRPENAVVVHATARDSHDIARRLKAWIALPSVPRIDGAGVFTQQKGGLPNSRLALPHPVNPRIQFHNMCSYTLIVESYGELTPTFKLESV